MHATVASLKETGHLHDSCLQGEGWLFGLSVLEITQNKRECVLILVSTDCNSDCDSDSVLKIFGAYFALKLNQSESAFLLKGY